MKRSVLLGLSLCALLAVPHSASAEILSTASSGSSVFCLQQRLFELDYFNFKPTASYGSMTRAAVMKFQEYNSLSADGVAGESTLDALFSASAKRMPILGSVPFGLTTGTGTTGGTAEPWSLVDGLFPVDATATVSDFITGESFTVKRTGGKNHASVKPVTTSDEETYLYVFGGTPNWSKRAVVVQVDGRRIAASIVGMPRGDARWASAQARGDIDLYFYQSTSDFGSLTDSEHSANIKKATVS